MSRVVNNPDGSKTVEPNARTVSPGNESTCRPGLFLVFDREEHALLVQQWVDRLAPGGPYPKVEDVRSQGNRTQFVTTEHYLPVFSNPSNTQWAIPVNRQTIRVLEGVKARLNGTEYTVSGISNPLPLDSSWDEDVDI